MGEFDRPEWIPSDDFLKEVVCRARETDWEWSDYRANGALGIMEDGTARYRPGAPYGENGELLEYNKYLWKSRNYPTIPESYMEPVGDWDFMSLSDILTDIFKGRGPEADHYRNGLFRAIDRYRFAAKSMLLDTYRGIGDRYRYGSDEYVAMMDRCKTIRRADSLGYEYMPEAPVELYGIFPFLVARESDKFDECRGEIDCRTDKDLVKKIIAVERIKQLISEWAGQDTPAKSNEEQPAEPAAGGAAEQVERPLTADARCKEFIRNVHESTTGGDLRFYGKMKSGRTPIVAKGDNLEAYIKRLHGDFKKENPAAHVASGVFARAFKDYKANLQKNNRY